MEMERKSFPFRLEEKGLDPEARTIKGYAAIMGNVDDYGDIIDKGAFTKTLQEQGHRVKVFYIHDFWEPIGKPLEMREVTRKQLPKAIQEAIPEATGGLFVHFYISETSRGNDALTLARDGVLDELSIGFRTVKEAEEETEEGSVVRHLKELSLMDVSLVPLAANEGALVTDVKLAELAQQLQRQMAPMGREEALAKLSKLLAPETPEMKGVVPFQDLPLASEEREWDAAAARARVATWAGGPDKDEIDWAEYKKAFLYVVDDQADQFGGYKMPIADVVDGKLTAVPRGIFAAAAYLDRLDASDADKEKIRSHLGRYYEKMDRDPPWKALKEAWEDYQKAVERIAGEGLTGGFMLGPGQDVLQKRIAARLQAAKLLRQELEQMR